MPRSITPLLADRLDISEEQTQSLLQSMLEELRNRAEADGVQLSGLGTFHEEDGVLTFTPSSSLRRRVNHQFEGLSEEDLSVPDDQDLPPLREKPSSEEADDTADETPDAAPEPVPEPEPQEPPAPSDESGEESIPTLDPIAPEDESGDADLDAPDGSPSEEPAEAEATEEEEEEPEAASEGRFLGPVPVVGGLLLVLALGGILWYTMSGGSLGLSGQSDASYGNTDQQAPQSAETPSSTMQDETSPTDESDTSGQQSNRFAGVQPDEQEATGTSPNSSGSWTIVVASGSTRAAAERMAAAYEGGFAPVKIAPGTVDNRTWYRVTLGRYASEAAAQRALNNHASALPSGAWTHRLQ